MPFSLFFDRNRMATFAGHVPDRWGDFTMAVLIALYVQNIMGYGPMRAAIGFIPFAIATAIGAGASSRLVTRFPPRVVVIAGGILLLGAMLCGSTLHRGMPYFPNLVLPIVVAGIGLGMINVPLGLALIASVGVDLIGPDARRSHVMLRSLGGPLVLAVIQAAITSRTLHLGGTHGPVKSMNDAQLHALDHGLRLRLMWLGGVVDPHRRSGAAHRLHRAAGGARCKKSRPCAGAERRVTHGLEPLLHSCRLGWSGGRR